MLFFFDGSNFIYKIFYNKYLITQFKDTIWNWLLQYTHLKATFGIH